MDGTDDMDALSDSDLECLGALRAVGMAIAEGVGRYVKGELSPEETQAFKGCDAALAFSRVARAVRQIIVLEQEVMGLREKHWLKDKPAAKEEAAERAEPVHERVERLDRPERRERFDDYNDYDDYFKGTPAEIIAQVRAELMALPSAALVMAAREAAPTRAQIATRPATQGHVLLAERPLAPFERMRPKSGHDPP